MTLAEILATLASRGVLPRVPTKKTAIKHLAAALGYASPEQCQVDAACREEATWLPKLEAHFQALATQGRPISASNRRNVRNDLRVTFRLAEAHGLLAAPLRARLLTKARRKDFLRHLQATAPYQSTFHPQTGPRHFHLPQAQWPPDIVQGWRTYQAKCGLRLRETTFRAYAVRLAVYLGYLTNICGRQPTWDDCFDVTLLMEFVRWHGTRIQRPISTEGRQVVIMLAAMAVVLEHPARRALADLRNTLPMPALMHNKRGHHWVSLATLEQVAEACLAEGRAPYVVHQRTRYPGAAHASRFQRGMMLKLLVRVPLRQRNVREMRLGHNLYQDQAGHWQLHFGGDELKIGTRGGRINEYNIDLSADTTNLVPVLEEWLQVHRPRLPNATSSPLCFLTSRGRQFSTRSLYGELSEAVALRTGQRFYPHLIRTIWATEYLTATQDFTTAATMLGDTLAVVMKTYYDIIHKDQHAKAKAFLGTVLQG